VLQVVQRVRQPPRRNRPSMSNPGNTNDSAAMNVWLHKQVMIKLAENGGKVPDSLKV